METTDNNLMFGMSLEEYDKALDRWDEENIESTNEHRAEQAQYMRQWRKERKQRDPLGDKLAKDRKAQYDMDVRMGYRIPKKRTKQVPLG